MSDPVSETPPEPEASKAEVQAPPEAGLIPPAALLDAEITPAPTSQPSIAPPPSPPAPPLETKPPAQARGPLRRLRRALTILLLALLILPPALTLIYRVLPPPITVLMIERLFQGQGLSKHWRSLDDIAPALPQAVIAAEDARFCQHHGFDFKAMRQAAIHNERRPGKMRGGSTISQQTAKNVFLWPSRDYVRKGLEAWFTVLEEMIWGKRRILEIYLNVVEWGPGAYGAQAAAQRYFHKDARDLSATEAARLAAILPSPLKWKAVNPGRYVQKRSARIGAAAATVRDDDLAWCVRR